MARLTDEEFRVWCQRNNIEPQTAAYIQRIREASPERKVHSRASNVSGRYPSMKMGFPIQLKGQKWGLGVFSPRMRVEEELELTYHPTRTKLHYKARSG